MNKSTLPPPEFRYDPTDIPSLYKKMSTWEDSSGLARLDLKTVTVDRVALETLPRQLHNLGILQGGTVLLVMDQTPMTRSGEYLKPMVERLLVESELQVEALVLEGDTHGLVHPDFEQVETVKAQIRPNIGIVALGSGVVTDITKHACFLFDEEQPGRHRTPLVFCSTANSAPAYASGMAVISKDGVKRTWPSRLPDAIVADTGILCDSPVHLTLGGVGDTSPMFTAFADWYLGDFFGMATYVNASQEILSDVREFLLPYSREIGDHTQVGMSVMAKILTQVGLSMTIAGESSPMSGYEHVISHMLDMSASHFGRSTANHGTQVGVASILHLIGIGRFLDEFSPSDIDLDQCYPSVETMEERVMTAFREIDPSGAVGRECWSDYQGKLENWYSARPRFERFLAAWETQKTHLESLILRAEQYVSAYRAAGHPLHFEELNVPVPEAQARWAYQNAHLMRKRFSHADLLFFCGLFTRGWTDRVFARMHELVDGDPK